MKAILTLILCSPFITLLESSNIIVLLPLPLYSHTHTFMPVFKELARRGHNVTMVSPYPQKEPIPNWTDVVTNATATNQRLERFVNDVLGLSPHRFFPVMWSSLSDLMEVGFQDETLQKLIKAEDLQFDLVIVEAFFSSEAMVAFGHKLNVPVVSINPLSPSPWTNYLTGNEISFSLMPNFRSEYTNRMTFLERIDNTLINLIEFVTGYFYYIPRQERIMKKYMVYPGSETRPSLLNMLQDISLTLLDYHFSVGYVQSLQPNLIPVGGLTLKDDSKLPKDLKDVMDGSKSGVIYISFGSFLRTDGFGELLKSLMEAMAKLEQTVLIKWDGDIPNKPKNVVVRKWYPQSGILAHPNLKLFMTHSGLHSTTEATYFGVPLVCVPFFSDQLYNSKIVEQAGYGLIVRRENRTSQNFYWAVNTILNDQRFKQKALEKSKVIKDKPHTALESAVYWIEYVIRHKGAKHLKPATAELNLYQSLSLDVAACFIIPILIFLLIIYKSIRFICCSVSSDSSKTKQD